MDKANSAQPWRTQGGWPVFTGCSGRSDGSVRAAGIDPDSNELLDGFDAQAHQVFRNLRAVCMAAGGNLKDIVRLGVFMTDMTNFARFNQIMGEYFTEPYPARTAIQVAGLPKGGVVEADAILVSTQE